MSEPVKCELCSAPATVVQTTVGNGWCDSHYPYQHLLAAAERFIKTWPDVNPNYVGEGLYDALTALEVAVAKAKKSLV